jgi:HprK-related kinase A
VTRRVGELGAAALRQALAGPGLRLRTGPFVYCLRSRLEGVAEGLAAMYADFPLSDSPLADFHLTVDRMPGLRGHWRPQVNAWLDGFAPFVPLPLEHGYALLEWAMNFCVAGCAHHYLMLHAACLERDGRALILPGAPGSGKSTLTAALMLAGWRLLSDEITLIDRDSGALLGLGRPVSLKNASLDVIRERAPAGRMGRVAHDTHKGSVGHLRPSADSVAWWTERRGPRKSCSRVGAPARPPNGASTTAPRPSRSWRATASTTACSDGSVSSWWRG